MFNSFVLILLCNHLFLLTTCLIIHKQRIKDHEEICLNNQFWLISTNHLRVCYMNNIRDHSILVWFKIDQIFFDIFHFYRFILRSIDEISLSTKTIYLLTNFTELIDFNNSLRILNLDSGQYEICLDFQSNLTTYIYSPRNGCIPIRIGEFLHRSFRQSSTQLLLTLGMSIILFLILGLIIQCIKAHKKSSEDEQSRNSTESLKIQHNRIIRRLFRRHIDQPDPSHIRQWARNRAFRHRISTQEQEIENWNKKNFRTKTSTIPTLTTNDIYTIPIQKNSSPTLTEEFELI